MGTSPATQDAAVQKVDGHGTAQRQQQGDSNVWQRGDAQLLLQAFALLASLYNVTR